jgi:hypothetical protein
MKRSGHEDVRFFVGTEVEHTPAYGMSTLFVVGVQPGDDIEYHLKRHPAAAEIEHVYFGANQSFPAGIGNNARVWDLWSSMIFACLAKGYWCTLDIDIGDVEGLLESGLTEHSQFIPMVSAKLPYISLLGYNATLKLDDVDFAKTNPGVWCHSLHTLQNRETFTPWSRYTKDEIIK